MFYRAAAWLLLLALSGSLVGCTNDHITVITQTPGESPVIKNITSLQADQLIKTNKDNANFVILDVRTPSEYVQGYIKNAVNLDYNSPDFKELVNSLDKNKTYLVYCRTGVRSAAASQMMSELGFKDIYNMNGGITDWQAAGLPIEK
jgi:rhodanese-related sulfurtransferase